MNEPAKNESARGVRGFFRQAGKGARQIGRAAGRGARRAAPRVRAFGRRAGTKGSAVANAASVKARYGLNPRQYSTWRRLSDKLDDGEELTPSEVKAYDRLTEKVSAHRERLRELGHKTKRLFYGSGRLRA